jgi:hypothetical protein
MRTQKIATIAALALPLVFGGYGRSLHAQPIVGAPAALHDDDDRDHGRDARDMGRRDGMQAAYDDMRDHRRADADDHQSYRHPPVDKHARDAYRAGFRDGYSDGIHRGAASFHDYNDHDPDRRHDHDHN